MSELFRRIAQRTAWLVGSPWTFTACVLFTALWLAGGLVTGFGSVYQLYYNTAVSAITWILVVLLQGSQNSDTRALQLKLDELLRAHSEARTGLVDLESLPQEQQERLAAQFRILREREQHKEQHKDHEQADGLLREGQAEGGDPMSQGDIPSGQDDPGRPSGDAAPEGALERAEPAEPAEDMLPLPAAGAGRRTDATGKGSPDADGAAGPRRGPPEPDRPSA